MITKKDLIGNELLKEIVSIRTDTLWKMLRMRKDGRMPGIDYEGATGDLDNKGAIFIPGGLVYQDVDENRVSYDKYEEVSPGEFRARVREAMKYDNAVLLYPDGMAKGINLDSGFFSKAARKIFTYKKAAMQRKKRVGGQTPLELSSDDITRSHCPPYIREPYGSRTRLSSCVSVGLIEPPMYFAYCKSELSLSGRKEEAFALGLDRAQAPVVAKDGTVLSPPYIVVCHDTRHREEIFTGITRILGLGRFGEFATFTLEEANRSLLQETRLKKEDFSPAEIFAEYSGIRVAGVLRLYSPTTPGKRAQKTITRLISPASDLGIDLEKIEKEARKRYGIR